MSDVTDFKAEVPLMGAWVRNGGEPMSRDATIESWLASMSKPEIIDQCFFWHDMALEHGRMYNAVKAENAKLRELVRDIHTLATDHGVYVRYPYCDAWEEKLAVVEKQMRELGMEVD